MSIKGALSAYEKMLQDPANRRSSSGQMKQPMPNSTDTLGADSSQVPEAPVDTSISAEEMAAMSEIDSRMAARKAGKLPPIQEEIPVANSDLERRVTEIEQLLVEVMKTHMKLLGK
jgi:hypothetical protein